MVRERLLLLLLGFILIFGNLVLADNLSSASYSMEVGLDDGGGETTGSGLTLKSILGTITGVITSTSFENLLGFFYGLASTPELSSSTLTSTGGTNYTTENLTSTYTLTSVSNNDANVVRDWRVDGNSLAVVNFPFDIDGGTTIKDYSTYENNGSCTNCPTWTSDGKVGGAYLFDGTNDYISFSSNPIDTDNWTISMWFNIKDSDQYDMLYSGNDNVDIQLFFHQTSKYLITSVENSERTTSFRISDHYDEWHYVTWTHNSIGERSIVFIDDSLVLNTTDTGYTKSGETISIGSTAAGTSYFINGSIDEVQIFDYPLSLQQIQANYQAGLANHSNNILVSQETTKGENYSVMLTPNYLSMEGSSLLSNYLLIRNSVPSISSVTIDSTDGSPHMPGDNVSITSISGASDDDNDEIVNITDWRVNGDSLAILNMPFDTNETGTITDYSTDENDGTCSGTTCPTWTSEGKVGGAYVFDGTNDYIDAGNILEGESTFSISVWINTADTRVQTTYYDGPKILGQGSDGCNSNDFEITLSGGYIGFWGGLKTSGCDSSYLSSTTLVNDSLWHHIAVSNNGTKAIMYVDGVYEGMIDTGLTLGSLNFFVGASNTGHSYSDNFTGSIDEVQIYNYSLSEEQIQANYQAGLANHSNDIIVSQEVSDDEIYTVAVTPTDGEEDGSTVISNSVIINNTPPTVTLTYPLNQNITDRTPTFTWTCADAETTCTGFTYQIIINETYLGSGTSCDSDFRNETTGSLSKLFSYPIECILDNGYSYKWAVRAYDGYEWGAWSNSTFGIQSYYERVLENNPMNFDSLLLNIQNDTTDDSPLPFKLTNLGNVMLNVSLYSATELWDSQNAENDSYQIKVRNTPSNWFAAETDWLNVSFTQSYLLIEKLNYEDLGNNYAYFDIGLTVPPDEHPGFKDSTIVFNTEIGE